MMAEQTQPTGPKQPADNSIELYCRWLGSKSKAESDRHFTVYYQAVHNLLVKNISKWIWESNQYHDIDVKNDLIQGVFERFLVQVQKNALASAQIHDQIKKINWQGGGIFHNGLISKWKSEAGAWAAELTDFCTKKCHVNTGVHCQEEAELTEREFRGLEMRGYRLVDKNIIQWNCLWPDEREQESEEIQPACKKDARNGYSNNLLNEFEQPACSDAGSGIEEMKSDPRNLDNAKEPQIRTLIQRLRRSAQDTDPMQLDNSLGQPGATEFVLNVGDTLDTLRSLRLPMNYRLFAIARNSVRDSDRYARRWKKASWDGTEVDDADEEALSIDREVNARLLESSTTPYLAEENLILSEKEQRLQKIWTQLRQGVERAEAVLAKATNVAERNSAQTRLAKERRYFNEYAEILGLIFYSERTTQEQLAESLGLTRDQIRYRIDKIYKTLQPLRGAAQ